LGPLSQSSPASPGPSSLPVADIYFAVMLGNILPTEPMDVYHSSHGCWEGEVSEWGGEGYDPSDRPGCVSWDLFRSDHKIG